ncbi:MAG: DISARM system phospholipase D-like protein DrmC [Vicinamibacterales bacterium]|nr:DISARM system phospholipase D-like protein DrmC [Vicinamibacterales bacterium]
MALFGTASASTLRMVAGALRAGHLGVPLTRFAIERVASCPPEVVTTMVALAGEGMAPAHLALLLDEAAAAAEAAMNGQTFTELVWTGPEGTASHSRDTAVVVEELFARAERSVLVSSFVVRGGATVFKPLAARMAERPELHVRLFLHVGREWKDTRDESELLREFAAAFASQWKWPQRPEVFYDPRTVAADPAARAAWHAKCVLVDDELAFVTSANFTEWAQQRNVEAGVLVRSRHLAGQLRGQFEGLVQTKQVRRLPGF